MHEASPMNKLFPNAVVDDEVDDLEYFAIEAAALPGHSRPQLVAVVADVSAELALKAVRESRAGEFFADRALSARQVSCPGLAYPLQLEGWTHFDSPEKARCPSCRRALAVIATGHRWSIRLVGRAPESTEKGHGIHTCQRSECRADMEIVVSQTPKGGNR